MNILMLVVLLYAAVVQSSTITFGEFLKFLVEDHQPVSTPMNRQYSKEELADSYIQPLRPGDYDLANDPDPVVDTFPHNLDNLIFLANFSEAQIHDLLEEVNKSQEIPDDNNGIEDFKEIDEMDFEESSGEVDNFSFTINEQDSKVMTEEKRLTTTTERYPEMRKTTTVGITKMPTSTTKQPSTTTLYPLINRVIPEEDSNEEVTLNSSEEDNDEAIVNEPEEIKTDVSESTSFKPLTTKTPSSVEPSKPKPSKRPTKGPNRKRRPGKRPNRRPIIINVNNKGSTRPFKIKINNSKLSMNQNLKRPFKIGRPVNMCPYECQCGVTTSRRIVGGITAKKNEFPWLALLLYNGHLICGGSVLNTDYIITAAHCLHQRTKRLFKIKLMQHDRRYDSEMDLVKRTISKVYIHTSYSSKSNDKDIALIKLSQPVDFSKSPIRPICLPGIDQDFTGSMGVIAGWGTTSEDGTESLVLKKAKVPIISNNVCKAAGIKGITSNMICAGRLVYGGVDSCQGDSGGPLMIADRKRYVLAGIVSFGQGCARPKNPGVYTRTTKFLDWIKNTANSGCYCK